MLYNCEPRLKNECFKYLLQNSIVFSGLHKGVREANDEEGVPPLHHLRRGFPADRENDHSTSSASRD
jgi:hypothetical protein